MNTWYQDELLEHYRSSKYRGTLTNPDFQSEEFNPSCGDSVSFNGKIKDGHLFEVMFTGSGCVISQAAASLLAERVLGLSLEDILNMNADTMLSLIKIPLGPTRLRCATLALDALQQGVHQYLKRSHA